MMSELIAIMQEDIRGMVVERGYGRLGYTASVLLKLLLYPRLQAVLLFRAAHWLYMKRLTLAAYYLQAIILRQSGAEIHPAAQIGPGFCLVHSSGTVISDRARIGAHFICFHGVTVGDHAVIGANSVVLTDIPAHAVAVGSPARVARIRALS